MCKCLQSLKYQVEYPVHNEKIVFPESCTKNCQWVKQSCIDQVNKLIQDKEQYNQYLKRYNHML